MDATQSFLNMLAVVVFIGLALSPFILAALLVNAVRKNNAKRRLAEQDRQAKAFAEAVVTAYGQTPPSTSYTNVRITEPQKLKVIRADGKRPWYLR